MNIRMENLLQIKPVMITQLLPFLLTANWKYNKGDALRDLVPFVQFKKREKHPWRSVTFGKVVDFSLIFSLMT